MHFHPLFLTSSLILLSIVGCNRSDVPSREIQREEDIHSEDFREKDSYNRTIPSSDDELEREELYIKPNESPETK